MRDIKFRVWHKEFDRFLSKEEYCLDLDGKIIFVEMFSSRPGEKVKLIAVPPSSYEVQQYTGLLDKNGKEIYEGDIIEHPRVGKCEVVFDNCAFRLKTIDNKNVYYTKKLRHFERYRSLPFLIVGNIFEE